MLYTEPTYIVLEEEGIEEMTDDELLSLPREYVAPSEFYVHSKEWDYGTQETILAKHREGLKSLGMKEEDDYPDLQTFNDCILAEVLDAEELYAKTGDACYEEEAIELESLLLVAHVKEEWTDSPEPSLEWVFIDSEGEGCEPWDDDRNGCEDFDFEEWED